jgi:integrase/recombinase XerD
MSLNQNEPDGQIEAVPTFEAGSRVLTAPEFQGLAAMPAEMEWFANINNPRTRKPYRMDVTDFMRFVGIQRPEEFRIVTRAHFIAWRQCLEGRELSTPTIRRKLSALSSLFSQLCDSNTVTHNPVLGVKRPRSETTEGKTPAIGDGHGNDCAYRRDQPWGDCGIETNHR